MADLSPQSDHIPGAARPSPGVFVGRQREMSVLEAALDDALSGQRRLVMLSGVPWLD